MRLLQKKQGGTGDKNMKRIISVLIFMLIFSNQVFAGNTDIPDDSSNDAVNWCIENNIITGYGDKINPDENITRAQLAVMLSKFGEYEYSGEKVSYSDVSESDWFYPYAAIMSEKDIMTGSMGKFNPDAAVTREEAIVTIARLLNIEENESYTEEFSDKSEISQWANAYVGGAIKAGIVNSDNETGILRPKEAIKKKEMAEMIYRSRGIQAAINNPLLIVDNDGSVWTPIY